METMDFYDELKTLREKAMKKPYFIYKLRDGDELLCSFSGWYDDVEIEHIKGLIDLINKKNSVKGEKWYVIKKIYDKLNSIKSFDLIKPLLSYLDICGDIGRVERGH